MLEEWLEYLKNYGSIRIASRLISEIETIREQMAFDESRMAAVASGLPMCAKAIVPEDVKNYLFGQLFYMLLKFYYKNEFISPLS